MAIYLLLIWETGKRNQRADIGTAQTGLGCASGSGRRGMERGIAAAPIKVEKVLLGASCLVVCLFDYEQVFSFGRWRRAGEQRPSLIVRRETHGGNGVASCA